MCCANASRCTWNRGAAILNFSSCSSLIAWVYWAKIRLKHTVLGTFNAPKNAHNVQICPIFRILCKKRRLLSKEKIKLKIGN